jgi:hypothetical protein
MIADADPQREAQTSKVCIVLTMRQSPVMTRTAPVSSTVARK